MKKICIPFLFPVVLFISCKKDKAVNTEEVRMLKVQSVNASGNTATTEFTYDQQGRIISTGDGTTISYSGDEMTITHPTQKNTGVTITSVVTYKLNADRQPVQRIQNDVIVFSDVNQPQTTMQNDTVVFEYDGSGLLTKMTGHFYDSTRYLSNGVPSVNIEDRNYTGMYTNSNGMLTQLAINTTKNYVHKMYGTVTASSSSAQETYSFEYNHKYPNKTDFTNATLFAELGIFYDKVYSMGKAYAYLPDKIMHASKTRDGSGVVISDDSYSWERAFRYNAYGFIASESGINYKTDFIYNY